LTPTPLDPAAPPTAAPHALASHSRFVQRVRRRLADDLALLAPGVPTQATLRALVQRLCLRGDSLQRALRVTRQLVLERLVVEDVERNASLGEVTQCMTSLAEVALDLALAQAQAEADQRWGPPLLPPDPAGPPQVRRIDLWVVGMGKLGGRELNVSSDIDLIYVYDDHGHDGLQTSGPHPVSLPEYFAFVAKRLYALVGETTEDGFVFRVDLALRPNGHSGPPVASLSMLETYFQVQGREWERFAWLKSRVVAPRTSVGSGQALALRALVAPFVYRRHLDYGVFEGLRQLHGKIRDEAQRRAAGRPERANDVKLSRGGIREIEFTVQLLLVVRGGQYPEIRTRRTLRGLQRLVQRGLMAVAVADALAAAYEFLRQVEHRIQYLDDQQTHQMPTDDADLAWVAASLGPQAQGPQPVSALLQRLGEVRELVAGEFDALLRDGTRGQDAAGGAGSEACLPCVAPALEVDDPRLLAPWPGALADRLAQWAQQPRVKALRADSRVRLGRLMQRAAQTHADGACTETATLRFVDWVDPLLRRETHLALLQERPEVQRRLLRLLGLARWPMQYLMRHPSVADELADESLLQQRFDASAFSAVLDQRWRALRRLGEDGEEQLLDTLRQAHHAELLRTLVRDVEGCITVEQAADERSALADAVLGLALRWAWSRLKQRHTEDCGLAVIAYGKLGGKELGYGSDLDLVFVYEGTAQAGPDDEVLCADGKRRDEMEVYSLFVRKLITWLTLRTAAGELFDIDTALRPNGSSGLLVTSVAAFERYQAGRGSNAAWTWEHQALTRARFVTGPPAVQLRFDATRAAVLTAPRDPVALRQEVQSMRERLRAAHPVASGLFDVKHSPGGMLDVEFAVQLLVLTHAAAQPTMLPNVGNIALLQRAQVLGLLPPDVGEAAADAYRELRRAQHQARLDEQPTQFPAQRLAVQQRAVLALWQAVFA
jgi:[glutamine synthetase] adenylyltransferase / [glutamine synthetase]-adenylyl-L-tyrosine phosphorylase